MLVNSIDVRNCIRDVIAVHQIRNVYFFCDENSTSSFRLNLELNSLGLAGESCWDYFKNAKITLLYLYCKRRFCNIYLIESPSEMNDEWLQAKNWLISPSTSDININIKSSVTSVFNIFFLAINTDRLLSPSEWTLCLTKTVILEPLVGFSTDNFCRTHFQVCDMKNHTHTAHSLLSFTHVFVAFTLKYLSDARFNSHSLMNQPLIFKIATLNMK